MNHHRVAALGLSALLASLGTGCTLIQRMVLFHPTHDAQAAELQPWLDQGRIIGYAREMPEPENVWLVLHGNGGQAATRDYMLRVFEEQDAVFVMEYPGYGQRAGMPSRKSFDKAARQAFRLLRARFPERPVCVVSESLGSGPASVLSGEPRPPDKIVLVVPFSDLQSLAAEYVKFPPPAWLVGGGWNNVKALAGYRGPVEVFGAELDRAIPVAQARALAASLPQAQFHLLPGGHRDWFVAPQMRIRGPDTALRIAEQR
jgi:uncharacterized protein